MWARSWPSGWSAQFGLRLGEVIEREPLRLRDVEGVGPRLASRLQEAWAGQRRARDTLMFLAEQGFSPTRANRIVEAYGLDAIQTIRKDPYALARDIRGVGFATADQVALKLGVAPDSVQRIGAAMAEVLREAADDGRHRPAAGRRAGNGWASCWPPRPETVDAGDRARAAGRPAGRARADGEPLIMLAELDRAERVDRRPAARACATGRRPGGRPMPKRRSRAARRRCGVALAPSPARRHRARDPQPASW